jgi:hypothetical protein
MSDPGRIKRQNRNACKATRRIVRNSSTTPQPTTSTSTEPIITLASGQLLTGDFGNVPSQRPAAHTRFSGLLSCACLAPAPCPPTRTYESLFTAVSEGPFNQNIKPCDGRDGNISSHSIIPSGWVRRVPKRDGTHAVPFIPQSCPVDFLSHSVCFSSYRLVLFMIHKLHRHPPFYLHHRCLSRLSLPVSLPPPSESLPCILPI